MNDFFLKNIGILQGLDKVQLELIAHASKKVFLKAEEILFREGDRGESLYIITKGSVSIIKKHEESLKEHRVTTLKESDTIGEMALIEENEPRSATVAANTDVELIEIPFSFFKKHSKIYVDVVKNISLDLSNRIRRINTTTVQAMQNQLDESQKRNALGSFMIGTITIVSTFMLLLTFWKDITQRFSTTTVGTVIIVIILSVVAFLAIKRSGFPYSLFGLTLNGWRKSLKEALLYSGILIVLMTLAKYFLMKIHVLNSQYVFQAIRPNLALHKQYWLFYFSNLAVYSLFSPAQEFVTRGGLQSPLYNFAKGSETTRRWIAILVANLLFSLMHLSINNIFAYAVLIPGLFWGWLYSRHKTLLGVCVSHILLGVWALFIMGLPFKPT